MIATVIAIARPVQSVLTPILNDAPLAQAATLGHDTEAGCHSHNTSRAAQNVVIETESRRQGVTGVRGGPPPEATGWTLIVILSCGGLTVPQWTDRPAVD